MCREASLVTSALPAAVLTAVPIALEHSLSPGNVGRIFEALPRTAALPGDVFLTPRDASIPLLGRPHLRFGLFTDDAPHGFGCNFGARLFRTPLTKHALTLYLSQVFWCFLQAQTTRPPCDRHRGDSVSLSQNNVGLGGIRCSKGAVHAAADYQDEDNRAIGAVRMPATFTRFAAAASLSRWRSRVRQDITRALVRLQPVVRRGRNQAAVGGVRCRRRSAGRGSRPPPYHQPGTRR